MSLTREDLSSAGWTLVRDSDKLTMSKGSLSMSCWINDYGKYDGFCIKSDKCEFDGNIDSVKDLYMIEKVMTVWVDGKFRFKTIDT